MANHLKTFGGCLKELDHLWGSQYCAKDYVKLLKKFSIIPSMSGKGNCYDNAPMESFRGALKNELIYHEHYRTREQAIKEVTEYIELFYNRQRRQKRLGYLSPCCICERVLYDERCGVKIFGVHY